MLRRGMRIAFLHLSPTPGQFRDNISRIEAGVARAADLGAEWVLTPELATSGYTFHPDHGVDWIGEDHDRAVATLVELTASANVTVFLGMPERDAESGSLYNALRVIDRDLGLVGVHRKVNALRVGSEAWSSQGASATVVDVHDFGPVGLLICADACSARLGEAVKAPGGARDRFRCELGAGRLGSRRRMGAHVRPDQRPGIELQSNRHGQESLV